MLGRVEPELLVGQGQGALGVVTGQLELTSMDGDDRDRKVVLRHLVAVLAGDLVARGRRARQRAPSARPRTRPRRGPTGRGRCAARPARATRRTRARAGHGPGLSSRRPQGCSRSPGVASCTSRSPPRELGSCWVSAARSSGVGALPANQSRIACTARARARSPASSSPSASSSAAAAWSNPGSKRVAQARRQWITDWSAGEVASLSASRRSSATLSTLSSARRMSASARHEPISVCANRSVAMDPGTRPLAGDMVGASRSQRPAAARLGSIRRGQPEGVLGELGRGCHGPALDGQAHRVVEHGCDIGIRLGPSTAQGDGHGPRGPRPARAISRERATAARRGLGTRPTPEADG